MSNLMHIVLSLIIPSICTLVTLFAVFRLAVVWKNNAVEQAVKDAWALHYQEQIEEQIATEQQQQKEQELHTSALCGLWEQCLSLAFILADDVFIPTPIQTDDEDDEDDQQMDTAQRLEALCLHELPPTEHVSEDDQACFLEVCAIVRGFKHLSAHPEHLTASDLTWYHEWIDELLDRSYAQLQTGPIRRKQISAVVGELRTLYQEMYNYYPYARHDDWFQACSGMLRLLENGILMQTPVDQLETMLITVQIVILLLAIDFEIGVQQDFWVVAPGTSDDYPRIKKLRDELAIPFHY
jgi:hypothetical protein